MSGLEEDRHTTGLIHHAYTPPAGFDSPQPGVFKASTVAFPNVAALHARSWDHKTGYTYGLHGTPTTFTLEERIATLEGGLHTLLVPSGLAAITLVNAALLKAGDEVLIPENAYGPSKELARHELARWGIAHRLYNPAEPQALVNMLQPNTRLVWLEAPGSVTMEFPDLPALIQAARTRGAVVALDNTWGAGLAFNPFALPSDCRVDISMQALTKYPSGGGDVLMGAVTTRNTALHQKLTATHMRMGWGVAGNDAELVLRSLPSIALRYARQDHTARQLAQWWTLQPEAAHVLHPALPHSPGHQHWRAACTQAAGLFSVVFAPQYSASQVHAFVDALRRFKIGYSWAGPVSLAVPYDLAILRPGHTAAGTLVRFAVGLEAADDLVADTDQALQVLRGLQY